MLARQNSSINEAVNTIYNLSMNEGVRRECEAREDYYRRINGMEYLVQKAEAERDAVKSDNNRLLQNNTNLRNNNISLQHDNEALRARIAELEAAAKGK